MEKFVNKLRQDYTHITFKEAKTASWSAHKQEVSYCPTEDETNMWSVLHELGHALLKHRSYESDVSLLQKEAAAWEKAILLAPQYDIVIDQEHIQQCLDTYRDWLHKRSACPKCGNHGLQQSEALYCCLNCGSTWTVSSERFCRPYRLKRPQKV